MSHNSRNPLHPVLLTVALTVVMLVAVIWLATPARITRAGDLPLTAAVEDLAPLTVQSSTAVTHPVAQIWSPTQDAVITQKDSLDISGFAWELGVTPPFIADAPVLSVRRAGDRSYFVNWTAVESAEYYLLEEADNPDFDAATETFVPAPTTSQPVSKEIDEDGTYYYRVRATRSDLDSSRWSNVESVVIPWTATSSASSGSAPSDILAPTDALTVEVRIEGESWQTVPMTATNWGGWNWSYLWSPLPEGQDVPYRIQARATDALGNVGSVDTITITLKNQTYVSYFPLVFLRWPPVPYAPTLNAIDNANSDGDYTVSWSYNAGSPPITADTFTLQEATDADFTNPTNYSGITGTSRAFSGKSDATYYYRVRGNNTYGPGPWSNVVSTRVHMDFFDDFSSSSSGWTTHNASSGLTGCDNAREHLDYKYNLYYQGGRYKINIPLDCRAGGDHGDTRHIYPVTFAPGVSRTSARTCVQMGGIFETWNPYWSFYGLVFAASEDKSTVFSLEVNNLGDWAIIKRTDYKYPGPNHPFQNETREPVTPDTQYSGGQRWPAKTAFEQNVLRVDIGSDEVNFYINGTKVYTLRNSAIVNEIRSLRKVGLIGGDWEITPTQIGYEYFFMDNGCDTY